jgi:hypothetical protein
MKGEEQQTLPASRQNLCEAIRCSDHRFAHTRVRGGMTGAVDDHQVAAGPGLGEFPSGDEWGCEIEAAVNQNAGDAR